MEEKGRESFCCSNWRGKISDVTAVPKGSLLGGTSKGKSQPGESADGREGLDSYLEGELGKGEDQPFALNVKGKPMQGKKKEKRREDSSVLRTVLARKRI